jgi:hypothetical protein
MQSTRLDLNSQQSPNGGQPTKVGMPHQKHCAILGKSHGATTANDMACLFNLIAMAGCLQPISPSPEEALTVILGIN